MNILIIPTWYSTKSNPVRGSFIKEQAIALHKSGHNVFVAYASLHPRKEFLSKEHFKLKEFDDDGIKTYRLSIPSFGVERNKKVFFKVYYLLYKNIIKHMMKNGEKIDIIHAHVFYPAGYVANLLKRDFNIPVVVTEHLSAIPSGGLSSEKIEYLKSTVINSDKFITVSESLKNEIKKITGLEKEIKVIPNVLSPNFYYENKEYNNENTFKFISVGGLIERKRHKFLIEAFVDVFKEFDNVSLDIIGGGPEYNNLENLIKENNMENRIRLLGILSREETAKKMRESDAFALLSTFETFGVVYIEALACGLPVIATINGGAEQIVNDNNGILINVDDKLKLCEALKYIYLNNNQYNKQEISKNCIEQYCEASISKALTDEYEKILYVDYKEVNNER